MIKLLLGAAILLVLVSIQPEKATSFNEESFFALNHQTKLVKEPDDFQALFINGAVKAISYEYKERPKPKPKAVTPQKTRYTTIVNKTPVRRTGSLSSASQGAHSFPWGWCTFYVAQKRHIPWSGNANMWITNARKMGYNTGKTPRVGAIVQTNESGWGHVGYVEHVFANHILVSEMNFKGFGVTSKREIPINSSVIKGYIY